MSLLNLTFPEFIALFSTASAVLVTLYLLDRSRRKQVVATLRFWKPAQDVTSVRHKRRIQQPWSLLLQMLSIALLLLAIAQFEWGDRSRNARDHIVVLDTSAWMGARTRNGTLMDDARTAALAWLKAVPSADRVMLVRADALATPVTSFDTNRAALERSIRESKPGAAALNLNQAIEFAARVQKLHSTRPGEIVYVGAGRIPAGEQNIRTPSNLRVIPISAPIENAGLRKIGLRRADAETWQVFISAENYGSRPRPTQLAVRFAGAPVGSRTLTLAPGVEQESSFSFRTRAAGWLEARLLIDDAFPEDDRATLEIPAQPSLTVAVYSKDADLLRPVLSASPKIAPVFRIPSAYDARAKADVMIFDRFAPPVPPLVPSIWIDPPEQHSPIRIKTSVKAAALTNWNSSHDLGLGLRTKDVVLETASVFSPAPDDVPVASVNAGPVILARPQTSSSPKLVVFGFHPSLSAMRYELATPLLFANILRWINPAVFQRWELNAGTVGTVEAHLDERTPPASVRVTSDTDNGLVPYSLHDEHLRFFAGIPGNYRLQAGDREIAYSLTLPDIGDATWKIPPGVRKGVPRSLGIEVQVFDLWPWLAIAGAIGLLVEWILYGRGRRETWMRRRTAPVRTKVLQRKAS